MKLLNRQLSQPHGLTLVELMIVVAVVGILAAIGGVSYMKYIKSAKTGKLKQYAMEIANAQEQYKSQNSTYLDLNEDSPYTSGSTVWEQLLGFKKEGLTEQDITVSSVAGSASEDCPTDTCGASPPDFTTIWFAVKVTQDMNPDEDDDTTVIYYTGLPEPLLLNEGM